MRRLLVGAVTGLTVVLLWAVPAGAEVSGSCTATMKGIDVRTRSSSNKSQAIKVNYKETLTVAATSTAAIDSYDVKMEFAGFKWNVASGKVNDNTWSKIVNVKTYATFGVGLYKVYGVSNGGSPCTGAVLVKVGGKSPLTTVAGALGAVLAAAALLGTLASVRKATGSAGYRVLPIQNEVSSTPDVFIDRISTARNPRAYVDSIESICRLGSTARPLAESVAFREGSQVRDIVETVCRWG
jgi:hypothetical protein